MNKMEIAIRAKVSEVRQAIGLSSTNPVNIFAVFDSLDLSLVKKPMESNLSGAFIRIGKESIVFINTAKSVGHQNFTAAHELYHAIFDLDVKSLSCDTRKFGDSYRDRREKAADLFASLFLMPEEAITIYLNKRLEREQRDKVDFPDVVYLEQLFQASHASMLYRLSALKHISQRQCSTFGPDIRIKAKLLGYPMDLYSPDKKDQIISSYAQKVDEAYRRDLISTSRYEDLLYEIGIDDPFEEEEDSDLAHNTPENFCYER